jgi:hypothetical protein
LGPFAIDNKVGSLGFFSLEKKGGIFNFNLRVKDNQFEFNFSMLVLTLSDIKAN